MGRRGRFESLGIWHSLNTVHEGFANLQGDRQSARSADFVGSAIIENTVRYLGVDIDDAIRLAERTEI